MEVITTDQCENCRYSNLIVESKARIYIQCERKDRKYFYGQYVACEDYVKEGESDN